MGTIRHGLCAAGYDNVGISGHDRLSAENNGFHTRRADFVDSCADGGGLETGAEGALAGGILTETAIQSEEQMKRWWSQSLLCGQYISKEDFFDILRLDGWYSIQGSYLGSVFVRGAVKMFRPLMA